MFPHCPLPTPVSPALLSERTLEGPNLSHSHFLFHTHHGCRAASPEVDASGIAGNVEHYNALQIWQGDGFSITLKSGVTM